MRSPNVDRKENQPKVGDMGAHLISEVREMKRNRQRRLSNKSVVEGEKWESVVYQNVCRERSGEEAE